MIKKINRFIKAHPKIFKWGIIIFFLFLLIIMIGIYVFNIMNQLSIGPKVVEVEEVQRKNIQQTISLIGTIKPQLSALLVAKSTGILDLVAQPGQVLQKGDLIAKIDNPEIEKNYELSEASEKLAKTQYERILNLQKSGHASAYEVETKKNTWIEAQKVMAGAKIELDKARVYAPFNGKVGVFKKHGGTHVNERDSIVSFYDPAQLRIEFDIPPTFIEYMKEGQPVRIAGNVYSLSHFQDMIDEDTHMCPANINITCKKCFLGSSIDVDLVIQEKKQTLVIPFDAVLFRNDQTFVYTVEADKVVLVPVKLGIREKEQVEITKGLKPGDKIVVRGQSRLQPQMLVKVYQPNPDEK